MEDQVPFKVFTYWKQGEKPEVRRFGVDKTLVTSFVYLNAKLQEIFPSLKHKAYSVTWTDEDSDDVTVSSDDELMTALAAMRTHSLIKLSIYVKDLKDDEKNDDCDIVITATVPENATGPSHATHFGVVCDGCDSPIVGFRYKCASCDDYDLCAKCEAAGMHSQHCMVRMPTPTLPRTVIKAAIKRSRHFLKTVASNLPEECHYKKHRRERSGERKHRGERGDGHASEHCTRERGHRRQRSSWLETFATYMNEFANLAGDADLDFDKKSAENKPQQPNQQQTQENTAANDNAQASDNAQPEPSTSTSNTPRDPFMEHADKIYRFMEMCGVKDFLDIPAPVATTSNDASVNTNDVPTTNASVNTNGVVTNNVSVNTNEVEMREAGKSVEADKVSVRSDASSGGASNRDESPDKVDDWTMINKEKDLADAYVKQGQTGAVPPQPGFNLPQEFQGMRLQENVQNIYPPLHAAAAVLNPSVPEEGVMGYTKPQATGPQPTAPQPTAPQPTAPKQAPPQPQPAQQKPSQQPRHPKSHIQAAIENMLAMGFTNDGGWLTQLLESKDGNIAAVLDLLTPVNPKRK